MITIALALEQWSLQKPKQNKTNKQTNKQTSESVLQYSLPEFLTRRSELHYTVQRLTDGSAVGGEISPSLTKKLR